jgi:MFS family permease
MPFAAFLRDNARWIVGGFLMTFFSTIGQTVFISLSAGHIRQEYGLSHGGWGTVYMIATLASALTLPYLGTMLDRHRVVRIASVVTAMLGAAALLMAVSNHIVFLLFAVYLLRLFGQGMMTHTAYTATARWFSAQRGRALSLVILGHNAGDAVFTTVFVLLAADIGWRNSWVAAACLLFVVALPLVTKLVAIDRTPRVADPAPRIVDARDWTRAEVVRDPLFYLAMTGVMAPSFIVTVVLFHQVYLVDLRGWSLELFASGFIVWAVVNSIFTVVSGRLIDRFSGLALLPYVLLPLGLSCFALAGIEAQWGAFLYMALVGVSNGLSTTLFGAVWPEMYGTRHLGAIRSLIVSATVLASAAGPGLTGFLIDRGVPYVAQLLAMGAYCVFICVVMLYVSRVARGRAQRQDNPESLSPRS